MTPMSQHSGVSGPSWETNTNYHQHCRLHPPHLQLTTMLPNRQETFCSALCHHYLLDSFNEYYVSPKHLLKCTGKLHTSQPWEVFARVKRWTVNGEWDLRNVKQNPSRDRAETLHCVSRQTELLPLLRPLGKGLRHTIINQEHKRQRTGKESGIPPERKRTRKKH